MSNVLIEELGPRGRRRVRIASGAALIAAALIVWAVLHQLDKSNQLVLQKWTDLFRFDAPGFLLKGLWATLKSLIVAGILSNLFGFGLALMQLSKNRLASRTAVVYVEIFRALPLLLLMIGIQAIDLVVSGDGFLGTFWSVVTALVLYNSAVLSEIFRAGVNSLDSGQSEAAMSVGLTYWQGMFQIILPQAVRRMVPAIIAQMSTIAKDASLGFVIAYEELVRRGTGLSNIPGTEVGDLQAYVLTAVIYFLLVWALAKLAVIVEQRSAKRPTATATADEKSVVDGIALANA